MKKAVQSLGRRLDQFELYHSKNEGTQVVFRANQLHSADSHAFEGWGLRVVRNGRVGFSSTTDGSVRVNSPALARAFSAGVAPALWSTEFNGNV